MKILEVQHGTDEYDEAVRGYVLANRINDVCAAPDTKRHREYLHLVQSQFMGEPDVDPNDQYRERDLVPRALEAYERKHGVDLATDRIYFHDDFPIAAAPNAVDGGMIGITVHVRQSLDTYRAAVQLGIANDMLRHAQAMMAITGLPYWIHLQYYENAPALARKMHEHDVTFDKHRAAELESALISFVSKSRFRAAENAA